MALQRIDIKADYACNNNCSFCVIGEEFRRNKSIGISEIKEEISKARNNGATEATFTGGEPTIRKEIIGLVSYAKGLGYTQIMLITNGRMLSNKAFSEKIVEAGANRFMFSIHGIGKKHDELTMTEGSFDQAMEGMKNIRELKQEIITDTVAAKPNYKDLPKIIDNLIKKGSTLCQIDFVIPSGNALLHREKIVPSFKECTPYIHKAIDQQKKKGHENNIIVMGVPYCFMRGYESYMNEPAIPKIMIQSSEKSHETEDYNVHRKKDKVKIEKCTVCEFSDRCEGVWKNYLNIYKTF